MFAAVPVAFLAPGVGGGGGGGGSVTVSVSPSVQDMSGFATAWVFDPITATVSGGSPSAYSWSFRNEIGGAWLVFAGQGTATATPAVDFIPFGGTALAEIVCTVTVSGTDYQAAASLVYSNLF